jgi:hypothetical protein
MQKEDFMHGRKNWVGETILLCIILASTSFASGAEQKPDPAIIIGESDLGGTVTGPNGAEAGVWVIAETTELPTKFAKMVVSDDHGRYLIPELPKAHYKVWVRGYGLVDSPNVNVSRDKPSISRPYWRPRPPPRPNIFPVCIGCRYLRSPTRASFPARAKRATAFRK